MLTSMVPIRLCRKAPGAEGGGGGGKQQRPLDDMLTLNIVGLQTMRFGSIAKVLAENKLEYYRISESDRQVETTQHPLQQTSSKQPP